VGEGQLSEPEIARGRERAAWNVCPSAPAGTVGRGRRRNREHAERMPRSDWKPRQADGVQLGGRGRGRRSVIFGFRFQFDFLSIVGCYHFC
jgi:hypothetical protein